MIDHLHRPVGEAVDQDVLDGRLVADVVQKEPASKLLLPDLERDPVHWVEVEPRWVQRPLDQKFVHFWSIATICVTSSIIKN